MAVKPAGGEVLVEERRTRIEAAKGTTVDDDRLPQLWEFVESLTDADWASGGYRFVVERGRPEVKAEERAYIGEFFEKLTPQEIARRWGGGDYTIWFKVPPKGQQLKYKKLLRIEGAPASNTAGSGTSSGMSGGNDPLLRLVDMLEKRFASVEAKLDAATGAGAGATAINQAVALTGKVFESATTAATATLQGIATAHAPATPAGNPMLDKLLDLAISKLLNPSDPIEQFSKMLGTMKALGLGGGGDTASGNPWAAIGMRAMEALPAVISEGAKGVEQYRIAKEWEFRTASLGRPSTPPIDVKPHHPPPPAPVAGAAPPPPAPPPAAAASVQPSDPMEVIERGLVNILNNQAYTIEEAAQRAAALMEDLMPGMPDQVAAAGEDQILNLFQIRPILANGVARNPRLTEFVKKFIEVVKNAPVMPNASAPPDIQPA